MIRPFNSPRLVLVCLCAIVSAAAIPAYAIRPLLLRQNRQQPSPSPPQAKITVRVALARVDVSITDPHGNFVAGLTKDNFRVYDDGVEQPITFFAPIEAPAQVLVLLETSPAVYLIHRQHLDAAYALLDGLAPSDRVALAVYSQQVNLVLPFTPDKSALDEALFNVQYQLGSGDLNFYDAVSSCLDWLSATPGKKALVLLSTGLDSSPAGHWESLLERVRASEVTIFPVALGGSLRSFRGSPAMPRGTAVPPGMSFQSADHALKSLADLSGGQAYFPVRDSEFVGIYHRIAESLRHEYTLGFTPARDGKFHSIRVEVLDGRGRPLLDNGSRKSYRIYARQGYQAPKPEDE